MDLIDTSNKELCYTDVFKFFVNKAEKCTPSAQVSHEDHTKRSYTLLEDLKIILVSYQFEEVHNKDYKIFEQKIPGRTQQSIKERF
jgi:hypothetical protein